MYSMLPGRNFLGLEAADVFSFRLLRYKTRYLLQHCSAVEMLYKHLMKGTDLISSHLRGEETEAQRKKVIQPKSPCRWSGKPGLPSPSSTPTPWVIMYQHPAGDPLDIKSHQIEPKSDTSRCALPRGGGGRCFSPNLPSHSCIFHWDGWFNFLQRWSMGRKEDLGLYQLIQCGILCVSNSFQVPQSSWVYFLNKKENRRDRKI